MESVTEDPLIATDEAAQRGDLILANSLGPKTIAARLALDLCSSSNPTQKTIQATMTNARQTKQRLDNIIAKNERLRRDLALEIAKSKQTVRQALEQPLRADDRRSRARQ